MVCLKSTLSIHESKTINITNALFSFKETKNEVKKYRLQCGDTRHDKN